MESAAPASERLEQKPPEWYPTPCKQSSLEKTSFLSEWKEDTSDFLHEIEHLKESIQPFDKTDQWDLAKRITNPYELIYTQSTRLQLPKSTCCLQPLSRSFFKMIEMLSQLTFFDRHKQAKLRSLHICEGPGGFIEAFLHMAESHRRMRPIVYGMTLKSTTMMIPGWRRASQFLQKHKNITLLYGPTRTGNIYEPVNQQACAEAVGVMGAHLITADGGFDFSDDFHGQEKSMLRLLISSAIIIVKCLAQDGDCVLKLFDCKSQATRDLLTLLASCFQSWTLYKPRTSRPCNSEWYFLGKGALRERAAALDCLCAARDWLETHETTHAILQENPLTQFLQEKQLERCKIQMEALKEVLSFCRTSHTEDELMNRWAFQRNTSVQWCHMYSMPTMYRVSDPPRVE